MSYQCGACEQVFTALGGFDRHQDVDYRRADPVRCADPAALGMTQNKFGRWQLPVIASDRAAVAQMRAEQPVAHTPGTPRALRGSQAAL